MSEEKMMRLSQVARKLNVGRNTIIDHLAKQGIDIDSSPNTKITGEQYKILEKEFAESIHDKEEAESLTIGIKHNENLVIDKGGEQNGNFEDDDTIMITNLKIEKEKEEEEKKKAEQTETESAKVDSLEEKVEEPTEKESSEDADEKVSSDKPKLKGIKVLGKIELEKPKKQEEAKVEELKEEPKEETTEKKEETVATVEPKTEEKKEKEEKEEKEEKAEQEETEVKEVAQPSSEEEEAEDLEKIEVKADKLKGLKVVGKIELPKKQEKPQKEQPVASSDEVGDKKKKKRPRKRIAPPAKGGRPNQGNRKKSEPSKEELSDKEIQEKIKATLAKLSGGSKKTAGSKYRREKRATKAEEREEALLKEQEDSKVLKVTEFISANDLAALLEVTVNDVISTCMNMGMFISINQRLDAEAITLIADEFGYNVEFTSSEEEEEVIEEVDNPDDLKDRAPIVTIMGHVDHGKTSLLDYIRESKVTETEAGGITQHIGAYDVRTKDGHKIAFLDTPGHEAFTAMRARGAKVTDVVIIVVAADDNVMPQTKEAINHAQVAGVPIVIAINKVDKPNANPDKVKEELANINVLVEDWGGKYQSQEVSAKTGQGIDELLEKVLLEAELLELSANPDKGANGTIIEASLDKGRGFVATLLVQSGTLKIGDIVLAGSHFGRVKAMFDHRSKKLKTAGPSTPVLMLGLNGAPQAGDKFSVMSTEREAREIATKREQIHREQSIRTKKHITLDEIGRRLAIGSFKELNVIVKGDVDGSVEALSDSLLKLSTGEVQVNIIHKAVGQISESDVLLASASDAVIIGFQVRPSGSARRLAEQEEIEIRMYSVIYDAINDVKDAMEGMLAPDVEEVVTGNAEVRDVFKISKIGTVAGCMVTDGNIKRNSQIRLIRDGIVVYTGNILALKRFKEDVNEVKNGYECGISIENFNDIKEGDVIESFEMKEIKRTL